jgi:hypothetical protein
VGPESANCELVDHAAYATEYLFVCNVSNVVQENVSDHIVLVTVSARTYFGKLERSGGPDHSHRVSGQCRDANVLQRRLRIKLQFITSIATITDPEKLAIYDPLEALSHTRFGFLTRLLQDLHILCRSRSIE